MLGSHALDGICDQLAGAFFAFFACFGFDLAIDAGHIGASFLFNRSEQFIFGFVLGQLRDLFQLFHLRSRP